MHSGVIWLMRKLNLMSDQSKTTPEFRVVPMAGHGQELSDLVRLTSDGFRLIQVGEHAYTLRRDKAASDV